MPVASHACQYSCIRVVQIDEDVASVLLSSEGLDEHVASFAVASAQKAEGGGMEQLYGRPETLAGEGTARFLVDQTNEIQLAGHRGELPANSLLGKKETAVIHNRNLAIERYRHTMNYHRTADSVLTGCLSQGAHLTLRA